MDCDLPHAPNAAGYNHAGLASNTMFYYRVYATSSLGNSGFSNIASATTSITPPFAPSGLSATAVSGNQINLSWTDNSSNEAGFKIQRRPDGSTWTQIYVTASNATSYNNTGLSYGTSYSYRVCATNTGGDSGYSNTATATTLTIPAAPSGLTATAVSASQINLSWTDNSSDQTGFKIQRSPDGSTWTQIYLTAANATSYSNTGLSAGVSYSYRVCATNATGISDTQTPQAQQL